MVKCAAKFEEGKSKNVRIHTFGVLLGKIHTDSYSPIITEAVMAFPSQLYPVERLVANWTKEMVSALFTFCVFESFKPGFDSIPRRCSDNKEKTTREKNKFFIPEKAFEKCIKKLLSQSPQRM